MPAQKLVVGHKVAFDPELGQLANRGEVFVVVHQLPETDGMFQYQIKSEMDGDVRIARETRLTRPIALFSAPPRKSPERKAAPSSKLDQIGAQAHATGDLGRS
jgi:hypothetical protein